MTEEKEKDRMSISIKQITVDDWKDYESIRHEMLKSDPEAFPPQAFNDLHDPEEKWKNRIENGIVILAYDGDIPIGMVRTTFDGNTAKLWNMYASGNYRGQGLGKRLMTEAMYRILATDAVVTELEVEDTQIPARNMYKSVFGFEEVGQVPNERGGHMITMRKALR